MPPFFGASPPKKRKPRYSLAWASEIVEHARIIHPRGWEILVGIAGLSDRQLTFLLACNDPVWPVLRSMAQKLDRWQDYPPEFQPTTTQMLRDSLKSIPGETFQHFRGYLTAKLNEIDSLGAPKKGGSGEA